MVSAGSSGGTRKYSHVFRPTDRRVSAGSEWTKWVTVRCNGATSMLTAVWRLLWNLVRDLALPFRGPRETVTDEQAQDDDLLDAWLDDDGTDATGL